MTKAYEIYEFFMEHICFPVMMVLAAAAAVLIAIRFASQPECGL